MSFRTDLLKTVANLRRLPGPSGFDVYTWKTVVRTTRWSGGQSRLGAPSKTDLEIVPRPKVSEIGGGSLRIGPITPSHSGGGYTPQQLAPSDADGREVSYVVTGPDGVAREYAPVEVDTSKAFGYFVTLRPIDRRVPY